MTRQELYELAVQDDVRPDEAAAFAGIEPPKRFGIASGKLLNETMSCKALRMRQDLYRETRYRLGRELTISEKSSILDQVRESSPRRVSA